MKKLITSQRLSFYPFKAILPALIAFVMLATKGTLQKIFLHAPSSFINDDELHLSSSLPQKELLWPLEPLSEAFESIGEAIFASYNNYFTFMLMMLFVNIILHGLKDLKRYLFMKNEQKKNIFTQGSADNKERRNQFLRSFLKSFLIYSLIYCFYQAMWNYAAASLFSDSILHGVKAHPLNPTAEETLPMLMPGRILEEQSGTDHAKNNVVLWKKPSLSIGKVMSELDICALSTRLSKDKKTIFVVANLPPALKIIDISDSEYPVILSSILLAKGLADVTYRAMVVSPDETKIYISNFENLDVLDISDFKSPIYLAKVKDEVIFKPLMDYRVDGVSQPNLLMSRDGQFLFVSGFGLQIFDISKPKVPVLVRSERSCADSDLLVPSSIALSQDGKTLYYTDGDLWIYNVEDPRDFKVINSFNTTTNLISSMILSKDYKTALVLSLDEFSQILLQKLDVSDIYSIKEGEIIELDQASEYNPVFLNPSPDDIFLLIRFLPSGEEDVSSKLLVFDTQENQIVDHEKNLINENDLSVLFTEDYKKAFVGSARKFRIVEFSLNFPNKNAFSNSSNILNTVNTQMQFLKVSFAPSNEKTLYSVSQGNSQDNTKFGVHRFSAAFDQLANLTFYDLEDKIKQMVITQDNQKAFLMGLKAVYTLDISNPENITLIAKYGEEEKLGVLESLVVSRDGATGFLVHAVFEKRYLEIIDFSAPKSPKRKGLINMNEEYGSVVSVLSKDERTIFIASRKISVYNVSDHSSPALLAQIPFAVDDFYMLSSSELILSPDGNTLFLKDPSSLTSFLVRIIDVSDVSSPQIRSDFRFPIPKFGLDLDAENFALSQDSKTFYILLKGRLMVIDVSNLGSPRYLGSIKIQIESGDLIIAFKLSNDGRKVYFFTKDKKCHIAGLQPVYTTYMKEDVLMLGERYNIDLQVLKMENNMEYNQLEGEYRFTKFGLVESRSIQNPNFEGVALKPAPSWMNFDLKNQVLTTESKRKNDLGVYKLYFAFSTKLRKDAFSKINGTEDLLATLLALAYVDNQLFLTENVGEYEDFILPVQYSHVKKDIYRVLKQYSFETFNEINLVQSLNLMTDNSKLRISTPSGSNLKVEVNLEDGRAKFLLRSYGPLLPTITNEKSRLVLEGNLKDINLALREVVIQHNLDSSNKLCDGQIAVSDRLNPILQTSVKNISKYFEHNLPPQRNESFPLTIQKQVDKELVYTGRYFQIKLNQEAFSDKYTLLDNLYYHMALVQDNNETVLPNWLSFSDMTLMGTPPEIVVGRDFYLMLIVKNEFQEFKEPIKLHVKISSSFVLTLVLKYSPYVITVLGLYIKANLIFNILGKKKYKHAKDFYVGIGEEITPEVIFPISFIAKERREARKILKFLEKKIGNKEKLLGYFMANDEKKLDKAKISETIKEIMNRLSDEEQEELGFYLEGHRPETRLVDQIIFDTLTMEMLFSKNEKKTRIWFEEIRQKWPEFVAWDLENSCFKIDNEKFERVLLQNKKYHEKETILTSLIHKSDINLELLKDAILAFAFNCQNINSSPTSVKFKVKEKRKGNWLKGFLKLDLRNCPFTEIGKIGYGMAYKKDYNTLFFDGLVKSDLKSKTIVFQVKNKQKKILKELWIIGKGNHSESFMSESNAKGKEYQVL